MNKQSERTIVSIRAANGSGIAQQLQHALRAGTPCHGGALAGTVAHSGRWYAVQSVAALNPNEYIFTLQQCDAPPPVPVPPPAPAEPTPAELMREIKVLQDMVAKLSRDLYAHGAPLVVRQQ